MNYEIEITKRCNFSCPGCNRLCNILSDPTSDLTMEDIASIVNQINTYDPDQGNISVLGGEPTLNNLCTDICKYLKNNLRTARSFILATNSSNNDVADAICKLGFRVLRDTLDEEGSRLSKANRHWNIAISPKEEGIPLVGSPKDDCINACGISVHKYRGSLKWCWCGPSTTIAKLLCREDFMKPSLKELLISDLSNFISEVCSNCIQIAKYRPLAKDTPDKISECFKKGLEEIKKYNDEVNAASKSN